MGNKASQRGKHEPVSQEPKTYALGVPGVDQGSPWSPPQKEEVQCGKDDHDAGDGWDHNGSNKLPEEVLVPLHHNDHCNSNTNAKRKVSVSLLDPDALRMFRSKN